MTLSARVAFALLPACLLLGVPSLAQQQPSPADLQKALAQLQQMQQNAPKGDPVDFHRLKELLPEELHGLHRTSIDGSRTAMMGMKVSSAEATYEGGGRTINVSIVDTVGTPFTAAPWAMLGQGYEQETDDGYEKVTTENGNLVHDSWQKDDKTSSADIILGKRFIVTVSVSPAEPGEAVAVAHELDLDALAQLAAAQ